MPNPRAGRPGSRLLIDEPPLQVLPSLACWLGLHEAIFMQQLHYWVEHYARKRDPGHYKEGHYWIWNTLAQWHQEMPFMSERTIQRVIQGLRELNILVTGCYNPKASDRTTWYRLNYVELEQLWLAAQRQELTGDVLALPLRQFVTPLDDPQARPDRQDGTFFPIPENLTESHREGGEDAPGAGGQPATPTARYSPYVAGVVLDIARALGDGGQAVRWAEAVMHAASTTPLTDAQIVTIMQAQREAVVMTHRGGGKAAAWLSRVIAAIATPDLVPPPSDRTHPLNDSSN